MVTSRQHAPVACGLAFLAALLIVAPTNAQLASDDVPRERTVPPAEQMRLQLENSRYRLGPFRVQPLFALRDFGYDNNVRGTSDEKIADWRSTVGAGVKALLPIGQKAYFRSSVLPEYTWYEKTASLRTFGGKYGGSLLGLFNHLSVETGVDVFKGVNIINSELEQSVPSTRSDLFLRSEVDIFRRLSLFATGESQRQRYKSTADDLALHLSELERNESAIRAGVRYKLTSFLDFSLSTERTETDFLTSANRDNRSDAVLLGIHYDRPRSFVNLSVGTRRGQPKSSESLFPRYRGTTGSFYASHQMPSLIEVDAFGRRGLEYGLFLDNPYYFETRTGVGFTIPIGHRLGLRATGEKGSNHYPVKGALPVERNDDFTAAGAGLAIRLYRNMVVTTLATSTRYSSNIPGFDRSIFRLTSTVTFGGGS